ncbi:WD40 repeat domain-containing protein [Nocardia goodfellowii]|uniref:WD40 repeat protein n=1 Tax=Nocardia goodfellowii TaxID=882446 RepID=A0ABS4QBG5_9NOCA|nr:hypothetical protein [Nocardia goodfellowii]MBP2189046.1 WD40 repeat protein [Nocardia goodfellowii]
MKPANVAIALVSTTVLAAAVIFGVRMVVRSDEHVYSTALHYRGEIKDGHEFGLSPDGKAIYVVKNPLNSRVHNSVGFWEVAGLREFAVITCDNGERNFLGLQPDNVRALTVSPDGRELAVGGGCGARPGRDSFGESAIQIWNIENRFLIKTLRIDKFAVYSSIDYSGDGKMIYAVGTSQGRAAVDVWNVADSRRVARLSTEADGFVTSAAVSESGEYIATATGSESGKDGRVAIWDLRTYQRINGFDIHGIRKFVFHPNGRLLIAGANDSTIQIIDMQSKKTVRRMYVPLQCEHNRIDSIAVSPDGHTVVGAGYNMPAIFWSTADGKVRHTAPNQCRANDSESGYAGRLAFSRNGSLFAMQQAGVITLWHHERNPSG